MPVNAIARVVVVGDANLDLVLRGDVVPRFGQAEQLMESADLVLGGSGAIVASGLARLGVPTALIATVGDDEFGTITRDQLSAAGVDTTAVTVVAGASTGLSVILSATGDRAILTQLGAIPLLSSGDIRAGLDSGNYSHVHFASPFLVPAIENTMASVANDLRSNGTTASLDTNWDPDENWASIAPALNSIDILFPNRAELNALAQALGPALDGTDAFLNDLSLRGVHVVVKDGAQGGWSTSPSGTRSSAPGIRVEVVDTTGAGDSFDAGYLAAVSHGIADESERLRWATIAGSLSTRAVGGTGAQPSLDELRSHLP